MKHYFSILIFLAAAKFSFGQVKNYDECKFDRLFIELQHPASFGSDSTDLQKYFDNVLNEISYKLTGKILIEVYIDTSGTPCCNSIIKIKQEDIDFDELKKIIDSMPKWNPGIQNGFKVHSSLNIVLSSVNKKLKVTIM
jgi:hypothetical protein